MLLFTAAVFGSFGTCELGFWTWRDNYLGRELPKRERILREFLTEPSNYQEALGGKLENYTIVRNYSDGFATYTYFVCTGKMNKDRIDFEALVQATKVHISAPTRKATP
jgi:hypothetical protein